MEEEDDVYEVESVVDHKKYKTGIKYRVRWKDYGEDDDTWEWAANLEENCTELIQKYWVSKGMDPNKMMNKKQKQKSSSKKKNERKEATTTSPNPVDEDPRLKQPEPQESTEREIPRTKEKIDINCVIGMTKKDGSIYYVGQDQKGEIVWISSERMKKERPDLIIDFFLPRFELHYALQERSSTKK